MFIGNRAMAKAKSHPGLTLPLTYGDGVASFMAVQFSIQTVATRLKGMLLFCEVQRGERRREWRQKS